jgi:hypothetical protein
MPSLDLGQPHEAFLLKPFTLHRGLVKRRPIPFNSAPTDRPPREAPSVSENEETARTQRTSNSLILLQLTILAAL